MIPGTGNLSKRFGGLQALDRFIVPRRFIVTRRFIAPRRFIVPRRFIALRAGGAGEGRDG